MDDLQPCKVIEIHRNKWDLNKLTSFYTAKEIINEMKRQPTEWEKMFANRCNRPGLNFQNIKQFIQLNIKKKQNPNPIEKCAEVLNKHVSKEEIANRHMKRCQTSLIIQETQIKTTMKHPLTLARMATMKNYQ